MRKSILLPIVAVCGGLAGLVVRMLCLDDAFELGTGLPIAGEPVTYVLWAVCLLTALLLALLSRGQHKTYEASYTKAFGTSSLVLRAGSLAGAVLFVLAGFLNIETALSGVGVPAGAPLGAKMAVVVRPILGVVCLAAAAGVWFVSQKLAARRPVTSVWPQLPGFACAFWVMALYQSWAQDPVTERYILSLLAVVLALLACVSLAGFAYGKGAVTRTLILCLVGASFGLMVLCDGHLLPDLALHLAMVFYLLSMATALLQNDEAPEPPDVSPAPTCGGSCQGCPGCGPAPEPKE